MKRTHSDAAANDSTDTDVTTPPPLKACRRRLVSGASVGRPCCDTFVEEVEDVCEDQTILLRFPCFDFFSNVHLCEVSRRRRSTKKRKVDADRMAKVVAAAATLNERTAGHNNDGTARFQTPAPNTSNADAEALFAPQAVWFVPGTLETDTPILVLNRGTPNRMIFEGQWCEVAGEGTAVSNRAIVHVNLEATKPLAATSPSAALQGINGIANTENTTTDTAQVASLLSHTTVGVTADEERRQRAELLKGWVYDRIDVPAAVLIMHRVR